MGQARSCHTRCSQMKLSATGNVKTGGWGEFWTGMAQCCFFPLDVLQIPSVTLRMFSNLSFLLVYGISRAGTVSYSVYLIKVCLLFLKSLGTAFDINNNHDGERPKTKEQLPGKTEQWCSPVVVIQG